MILHKNGICCSSLDKEMKIKHTLVAFILGCLVSIGLSISWLLLGQPWGDLEDGSHYLTMYTGGLARAPFGYRILTPYLASLLPFSSMWSFGIITVSSLTLTGGILAVYAQRRREQLLAALTFCVLWGTSYTFAYCSTTLVRADATMLLVLSILYALSLRGASPAGLGALVALGILAHETTLIFILAIFLDKLLSGNMTGGTKYRISQLLFLSAFGLAVFILSRTVIPTLPPLGKDYMTTPLSMFKYVLDYSGGILLHVLRIFASYGPVLFYGIAFLLVRGMRGNVIVHVCLLGAVVGLTFLATDTLRVMAILYLPVLYYASKYLEYLRETSQRLKAFLCLFLQILFSIVVYGHLRSFESSRTLVTIAAGISISSFILCLTSLNRIEILDRLRLLVCQPNKRMKSDN